MEKELESYYNNVLLTQENGLLPNWEDVDQDLKDAIRESPAFGFYVIRLRCKKLLNEILNSFKQKKKGE